jgi:hypothetical protein
MEGLDRGELIRREAVSGVSRLRFDHMEQVQIGSKSLSYFRCGGDYGGSCI